MKNRLRSHHFCAVLNVTSKDAALSGIELLGVLQDAVHAAGLTPVAKAHSDFEPHGASAVLLLQESHVAAHIWPEFSRITIDIHVCDFNEQNLDKAKKLSDLLSFADENPANRTAWSIMTSEEKD
jgi:S-adenosylmethionine decarboxylase